MRPRTIASFAALTIGGFALYASHADGPPPTTHPASKPVSIDELRERGIAGKLGVPLGTMVKVTGKAVRNDSLLKADEGEPFFLEISTGDGKPLTKPVDYPFRERMSGHVTAPKLGDSFELRGYETGGYTGVPLNYRAFWQDTGFYCKTEFLVLPSK